MNWLREIHTEAGKLSSKRVYGGMLVIASIGALYMQINTDFAYSVLYIGAVLIGFGTTIELAKAVKGGSNESK